MPRMMPDMFFSATKDNGKVYVKIVNRSTLPQPVHIKLTGLTSVEPTGKSITLRSARHR